MTSIPLLLSLVLVICLTVPQTKAQADDITVQDCVDATPIYINVKDDKTKGYIVTRISSMVAFRGSCADMVVGANNTILLNRTLTSICEPYIECALDCIDKTNEHADIRITIQRNSMYMLEFGQHNYKAQIRELAPLGTMVGILPPVTVSVAECSYNTKPPQEFSIKDDSQMFEWITELSANSLAVNGDIDYERNRTLTVDLTCIDKSLNNSTATVTIHVTVVDVDDQNPTFDTDVYYLNITEEDDTMVDTELDATPPVHAYDQDFGLNTSVVYTIIAQDQPGLFTINETTGQLSVTHPLDREQKSMYTLIIKAAQTDDAYRTATATVSVSVLDVDDNPPKFHQDQYNVSINEHAVEGTTILIVTAIDQDEGVNAEFTYNLSTTSFPVAIDPDTGRLTVTDSKAFDREDYKDGIMNIQVEAIPVNSGSPNDTAIVAITLIDINDNNPNFTKRDYSFSSTGAMPLDVIGVVYAEDADDGPNANVTYAIVSTSVTSQECNGVLNEFPFAMDSLSGTITVKEHPACAIYTALLEACDNPLQTSLRRCSIVPVRISHNTTLGPMNISQEMSVSENSPNGTTVGVIKCPGGSMYNLESGEDAFNIDTTSGLVLTNKVLDRENVSTYLLTINVMDHAQPRCHVNITIRVADVNDNPPLFLNTSTYVFNLKENSNEAIGTVKAVDMDDGLNAEIAYYLQNQRQNTFSINSTTGEIYIFKDNGNPDIDIVRLTVKAQDKGMPTLTAMEHVYLLQKDQPSGRIPIKVLLPKSEINDRQSDFERDLLLVTGIPLAIKDINEMETGSMLQIVYLNATLDRRDVLSAIVDNYEEIRSMFYSSQQQPLVRDIDDDKFGATEIGLIVLAAIILIGAIVAIIIVRQQCNRTQRYRHLYESLTRNSSIYESQEIKVKMDDDSSQFTVIAGDEEIDQTHPGIVSATVNPAYEPDDDITDITEVKTTRFMSKDENANDEETLDASDISVEDAMESLDQLSDRLEQEDNVNAVVYDQVNTTSGDLNSSAGSLNDQNDVFGKDDMLNTDGQKNDSDDREESIGDNTDEDDVDISNDLAQRVLQSRSRSPVMSRKIDDESDDHADDDDDKPESMEEPNPDYDIKQVRFSSQVLDAAKNKIEPLKESKDKSDADANEDAADGPIKEEKEMPPIEDISAPVDANETKEQDKDTGGLMLEEEINSPVDFLTDTGDDEFYFGVPEETTHF